MTNSAEVIDVFASEAVQQPKSPNCTSDVHLRIQESEAQITQPDLII